MLNAKLSAQWMKKQAKKSCYFQNTDDGKKIGEREREKENSSLTQE